MNEYVITILVDRLKTARREHRIAQAELRSICLAADRSKATNEEILARCCDLGGAIILLGGSVPEIDPSD